MKWFFLIIVYTPLLLKAQHEFPGFLAGTWKAENAEKFEHWDRLSDDHLKGISYTLTDGRVTVTEYAEIVREKKKILYKVTVPGQNNGNTIRFTKTSSGQSFVFENQKHDFPKKIEYIQTAENEMKAMVSDGEKKEFTIRYTRWPSTTSKDSAIQNPRYDKSLAEKLGGDAYGMKRYIFVILKTGPNDTTDKEFINRCFKDHMQNIKKLVAENKLIVAGPMQKNELGYRGIFILNTTDSEEAKSMMLPDSAIREGLLDAVLFTWYGSAALPEYLDASDKIWKTSF